MAVKQVIRSMYISNSIIFYQIPITPFSFLTANLFNYAVTPTLPPDISFSFHLPILYWVLLIHIILTQPNYLHSQVMMMVGILNSFGQISLLTDIFLPARYSDWYIPVWSVFWLISPCLISILTDISLPDQWYIPARSVFYLISLCLISILTDISLSDQHSDWYLPAWSVIYLCLISILTDISLSDQ